MRDQILREDGQVLGRIEKSFVAGHWRTGADGRMAFVQQYQDARIKHIDMPHPDFHGMAGAIAAQPEEEPQAPPQAQQPQAQPQDDFKQFFGDWEHAPEKASQVTDETGEPLPLYPSSKSTDGPLGPGHYFGKTPPRDSTSHAQTSGGTDDSIVPPESRPALLERAGPISPQLQKLFLQHGDLRILNPDTSSPSHYALAWHAQNDKEAREAPVYLNIRKPLLMDRPLPTEPLQAIVKTDPPVGYALSQLPGWPNRVTGGELVDTLGKLGRAKDVTYLARQLGFDGIGSEKDGAWVAFDPHQVKSSAGMGHPADSSDILKAVERNKWGVTDLGDAKEVAPGQAYGKMFVHPDGSVLQISPFAMKDEWRNRGSIMTHPMFAKLATGSKSVHKYMKKTGIMRVSSGWDGNDLSAHFVGTPTHAQMTALGAMRARHPGDFSYSAYDPEDADTAVMDGDWNGLREYHSLYQDQNHDELEKALGEDADAHPWLQALIARHGITTEPSRAGFMLPSGRLIDVRHPHEGNMEHHDVANAVVPEAAIKTPGMRPLDMLMQQGAMRFSMGPEHDACVRLEHHAPITVSQREAVKRLLAPGGGLMMDSQREADGKPGHIEWMSHPTVVGPASDREIDTTLNRANAYVRPQSSIRVQKALGDDSDIDTGYHGTAEKWLPRIMEQGLRSTHETGIRNYTGALRAKTEGVYMTRDPHRAMRVANGAAGKFRSHPALIIARNHPSEGINDEDYKEFVSNNLQTNSVGSEGWGMGSSMPHQSASEVREWIRGRGGHLQDLQGTLDRLPDEEVMNWYRQANQPWREPGFSTANTKRYMDHLDAMDQVMGPNSTWRNFGSAAFPGKRPEHIVGAVTWPRIPREDYEDSINRVAPVAQILRDHHDDPMTALQKIEAMPGFTVHYNPRFQKALGSPGFCYIATTEAHLPHLVADRVRKALTPDTMAPHYPAHPMIKTSPVLPGADRRRYIHVQEPDEWDLGRITQGESTPEDMHAQLGHFGVRDENELHHAGIGPGVLPNWNARSQIGTTPDGNTMTIEHEIQDPEGHHIMTHDWHLKRHGQEHPLGSHIELHRSYLDVNPDFQGTGVGSAQNSNIAGLIHAIHDRTKLPVRMTLLANSGVGGYYWGKIGMHFQSDEDREELTDHMLKGLDDLSEKGTLSPGEQESVRRKILGLYADEAHPYDYATADDPSWPRYQPEDDGKNKAQPGMKPMPIMKHLMLKSAWRAHAWHDTRDYDIPDPEV